MVQKCVLLIGYFAHPINATGAPDDFAFNPDATRYVDVWNTSDMAISSLVSEKSAPIPNVLL
jgi:hypothetical protein